MADSSASSSGSGMGDRMVDAVSIAAEPVTCALAARYSSSESHSSSDLSESEAAIWEASSGSPSRGGEPGDLFFGLF